MNDAAHNPPELEVKRTGFLAWFATNPVAANLVLLFVIGAGLMSLSRIQIEFFPDMDINYIVVSVPYPGATPEEVEKAICLRVEEAVREVDFIKQIRAVAREGAGVVTVEFDRSADMDRALDDMKQAVDRITTFPEETEQPEVTQAVQRNQVMSVALHGDVPRRTLKELGEQVRDELTTGEADRMIEPLHSWTTRALHVIRPPKGISTVELKGLPPYEIAIELSEEAMRRYGLQFEQVSAAVARASLDLPGGTMKTRGGNIMVRTTGQRYRGDEFEDIVVLARPDGADVRVGDVARVIDGFEDTDLFMRIDGEPALLLDVYAVGDQDTLEIADTCRKYMQVKNAELPRGASLSVFLDNSALLKGRISLLARNGRLGLLLVFLILACFLDLRLAMWTTLGIFMSFLGAFLIMPMLDVSLNMISLFAFIVVLGIVVDDAIVVGEHIFHYRQKPGISGTDAAIKGAREMAAPVTMAILTTIAAFAPLLEGEGVWFQILKVIPIVVIAVLVVSLVEAFVVLPSHLSGGRLGGRGGPIARFQKRVRTGLAWIIDRVYRPVLTRCVRWRYVTLAGGAALLMATLGLMGGGHLPSEFFPAVEADNMVVALNMAQGTPARRTDEVVGHLADTARQTIAEFEATRPDTAPRLAKHISAVVGGQPMSAEMTSRGGGPPQTRDGAHLGEVNVALLEGEKRDVKTRDLIKRWRGKAGEITGATTVDFSGEFFSRDAVNVELSHPDHDLLMRAVDTLKQRLGEYTGVTEISDNFVEGKRQIEVVGLTPLGHALGVSRTRLAWQIRHALHGAEAQRIQRGRNEVKVMVRYPHRQRESIGDLEAMRVRLDDGTEIPFLAVAKVAYSRDYAAIQRTDRRRAVAVIADVNDAIITTDEINEGLREVVLPDLMAQYPDLIWDMEGEQRERNDAMSSLKSNFIVALLAIYVLLAAQFRSYFQPLIVMIAIPFGVVGAVIGHIVVPLFKAPLMGDPYSVMPLSFMSFFGIVALTGVVVNDSLIMIDLVNRERREGRPLAEVIEHSGTRRFRPILLTTLTTFFGLLPMVLETSLQAQFLIPMAVSLSFGVAFATGITLLLVPSLYMILEDVKVLFGLGQTDHPLLGAEPTDV